MMVHGSQVVNTDVPHAKRFSLICFAFSVVNVVVDSGGSSIIVQAENYVRKFYCSAKLPIFVDREAGMVQRKPEC
ncbi:Uncharacterized protein APZ42_015960 [Daphnia magna]|uniref:Uncharacterized protein n=1 Tax=Daphnia magna TaxID=35525 RepID=A0A162NGH1_9CRUS|nr:Uncharacterized protein APZ42_015960 [Daphnia magna]